MSDDPVFPPRDGIWRRKDTGIDPVSSAPTASEIAARFAGLQATIDALAATIAAFPPGPAGAPGVPGAPGTPGAVGADGSGQWVTKAPLSPDAWDLDAATMVDPDLGANGWVVKGNGSPWTVFSRSGNIITGTTYPSAGTYRSTLINGRLVVQFPGGGSGVEIFKPTAGDYCYKFHMSPSNWDNTLSLFGFVADGTNFNQTGNSVVYSGRDTGSMIGFLHVGPATYTQAWSVADPSTEFSVDRVLYMRDSGSGSRGIAAKVFSTNGVVWRAALPTIPATFTTSSAGILLASDNSSGPNMFYIDQIRRLPPATVF